jgi:hypothetical protein
VQGVQGERRQLVLGVAVVVGPLGVALLEGQDTQLAGEVSGWAGYTPIGEGGRHSGRQADALEGITRLELSAGGDGRLQPGTELAVEPPEPSRGLGTYRALTGFRRYSGSGVTWTAVETIAAGLSPTGMMTGARLRSFPYCAGLEPGVDHVAEAVQQVVDLGGGRAGERSVDDQHG